MDFTLCADLDIMMNADVNSFEFKEFCSALDEMTLILDHDVYMEAVTGNTHGVKGALKDSIRNTASTTKDVGQAYGDIVNQNSKLIKSIWDLSMKALNLSIRILGFVIGKITLIPKTIINISNKVGNIPDDIRNKIKGNIKLNITAKDIENLYNTQLFNKIKTFISLTDRLAQGDTWGTFFHKRVVQNGSPIKMKENDMKICREMEKIYEGIRTLEFHPSTIEMRDKETKDTYFGNNPTISFVDLAGKQHNSTYYEALHQLITDINSDSVKLKKLHGDLGDKYTETQVKASFSKLDSGAQYRISSTIKMMSKVINVIGNIVRYVEVDIHTIDVETDVLLKKQGTATK